MQRRRMELLERFAAGDVEAFEALFRQHQCEVYGWILRIVRDRATAEDLTIETFWRMYRAHARFDAAKGNCGVATANRHKRSIGSFAAYAPRSTAAGGSTGQAEDPVRRTVRVAAGNPFRDQRPFATAARRGCAGAGGRRALRQYRGGGKN